jgi:hypothetical protein
MTCQYVRYSSDMGGTAYCALNGHEDEHLDYLESLRASCPGDPSWEKIVATYRAVHEYVDGPSYTHREALRWLREIKP